MPFFECRVSRTVLTDDLRVGRATENVFIQARDETEAKQKAKHPKYWLRSAVAVGKPEKSSSFLLTVEECRALADDEVKALRLIDPAFAPALFEHDDSRRA
jgi:hypothetical protein